MSLLRGEAKPRRPGEAVDVPASEPTILRCQGGPRDVVYLHGRGSDEQEARLALPLLGGCDVRSYRGPIKQGPGFAWFVNRGIGVADEASLAGARRILHGWIAADDRRGRPWLCGFSNGGAMAASMLLHYPHAYAGAVVLGGCFADPSDALVEGGLAGVPVLFCSGRRDAVIPSAKVAEATRYLLGSSEALATVVQFDGGHELPLTLAGEIGAWLADTTLRLD